MKGADGKYISNVPVTMTIKGKDYMVTTDSSGLAKLKINKKVELSPEFKLLWDKIKQKTRYSINMDIEKLKKSLSHHTCASLAYKINNTIKITEGNTIKTLDRSNLFGVITPQAHHTEIFKKYLEKVLDSDVIYDDLMVYEKNCDIRSDIIFTMNNTLKVTTIEDLGYVRYLIGEEND